MREEVRTFAPSSMKQILLIKPWQFTSICLLAMVPYTPIQEIFGVFAEGLWYFWMFSISFLGQKNLNYEGMNQKKSTLLIIAAVFIPIARIVEIVCTEIGTPEKLDVPSASDLFFIIALLVNLTCALYLIFRTARIFTILDLKRDVSLNEISKRLPLVVGAVIAIWFLQPKLKLLTSRSSFSIN